MGSPGLQRGIGNRARMRTNEVKLLGAKERGGKNERFFAFFVIFCRNLQEELTKIYLK
jgi:hypothetical protein